MESDLRRLINAYQVTQALHVAAVLGIADLLAGGGRTSDELAAATDAHPDTLYLLLRALASVGVFREEDDRRFTLTELGEDLRSDVPGSLAGWAAFVGRPASWEAWGALLHSVRTGENAYANVHGAGVWEHRSRHPEEQAAFDRAMTALTGHVNRSLLDAYDFGRFGTVVDVGGSHGTLLAALLAEHPDMRGVLFDQPQVVAAAEDALRAAGVADRCDAVGGSFFDGVPTDGDAYVLKSILHDWEDDAAAAILRRCRAAMSDSAVVLVVERLLGPPNTSPGPKFSDLTMLVAPGGRERSEEEFAALFADAGLRLAAVVPTASDFNVIEAAAAAQ
jgi:O-methyltransferase/methyltransferase family protein